MGGFKVRKVYRSDLKVKERARVPTWSGTRRYVQTKGGGAKKRVYRIPARIEGDSRRRIRLLLAVLAALPGPRPVGTYRVTSLREG